MTDKTNKLPLALRKNRSDSLNRWVWMSFALSALILTWTFSLPFRVGAGSTASVDEKLSSGSTTVIGQPPSASVQAEQRRWDAEEFYESALVMDDELLRAVAKKNQRAQNLPGKAHAKRHRKQHAKSVKRQLALLGTPKPGTPQWSYMERLMESQDDGPIED